MKKFLVALLFSSSMAHAAVDYIAIGMRIREVNERVAAAKAGVACVVADYDSERTCAKIEKLNTFFQKLLDPSYAHADALTSRCGSGFKSLGYARDDARGIRNLARDAQPSDAIWAVIERFERSLDQYEADVRGVSASARLQETYVSQCMFGIEPDATSVIDLICRQ